MGFSGKFRGLSRVGTRILDLYFWFVLVVLLVGGIPFRGDLHLTYPVDMLRIGAALYALLRLTGIARMRETSIYGWIDRSWNALFDTKPWRIETWAWLGGVAWLAGCFVLLPLLRHWNFGSGHWDLGVIENAIYNGSRDLSFKTYLLLDRAGEAVRYFPNNRLDLSLFAFAGIFRFFPATEILLVLQSLALLSGVVPVALLAKRILPREFPVWIAPLFYFGFDVIHRLNVWDIHGHAYVIPIALWAIYFIENGRWNRALVFMFLSAIWREDAWILFCGLVIYYALRSRRYVSSALLFMVGLPVLPLFSAMFQQITPLDERYSYLGKNFAEAGARLSREPWLPIRFMFENASNREFLGELFFRGACGVFLLAGIGPLLALAAPLSEVALASHLAMHSWLNHYVGMFAAPLIACVILGWRRASELAGRWPVLGPRLVTVSIALSLTQLSYLEPAQVRKAIAAYPNYECLRGIVAAVPSDARVITKDPFITQLDKRPFIGRTELSVRQDWANTIITADRAEFDGKGPWKTESSRCGYLIGTR